MVVVYQISPCPNYPLGQKILFHSGGWIWYNSQTYGHSTYILRGGREAELSDDHRRHLPIRQHEEVACREHHVPRQDHGDRASARLLEAYRLHPEADLIHFRADGHNKVYPPYFITSFEITLRQKVARKVRFDERFGLGSPYLNAGEEEVFVCDVRRQHFIVLFLPYSITKVEGPTTGDNIREPRLQRSKGAVWYYTRGLSYALYKSVRESMGLMLRKRMNPIAVFRNMLWGINYIRRWQP